MHMDAYQTVPRPRWQQYLRWVITRAIMVVFIAAISSAITAGLISEKRLPALIADLQGTDADIEDAFQKRLEQRFPIGAPETDLIHALASEFPAEGFVPSWNWTPYMHAAEYSRSDLVCRRDWIVVWHIDQQHHLSDIRGMYERACL